MSFIQNFFTSRDNNANTETYVGQVDRLWYNPDTNSIRVSDGNTPGGLPIDLDTDANLSVNSITANTGTINGNLVVVGNITPASIGKIGGIAPGPGVNISNSGLLTIDTANLPVSFGNFTANNNILSIVNLDEDMILATQGDAEIQLVGNIGFFKDSIPPLESDRFFYASSDGQIEIIAATPDNLNGAVKITGNQDGITQTPVVAGVMLQLTGQPNIGARLYSDSNNDRTLFVGRRYNGTAASPTPVLAGEEVLRIAATGYPGNTWPSTGLAQIRFVAEENQTSTARGGRIDFTTTPLGQTTVATILTLNDANGASATKFTTAGTVSAGGNITGANINVGSNLVVTGDIRYNIASNNAVVTQLTSKSTAVTANGRTGQITTNNASLSQSTAVTFTVNNTFVSANDVIMLSVQSGATTNSYNFTVTRVNGGAFDIQIRNFSNSALADTIVINFAVIKVS